MKSNNEIFLETLMNSYDPDIIFWRKYKKFWHPLCFTNRVWKVFPRLIVFKFIRSTNFLGVNLNYFVFSLNSNFSIIYVPETWLLDLNFSDNSFLENYQVMIKLRKKGESFMYIYTSLTFKCRSDLSINFECIKSFTAEIFFDKEKII